MRLGVKETILTLESSERTLETCKKVVKRKETEREADKGTKGIKGSKLLHV
jgi:hypothetical protein